MCEDHKGYVTLWCRPESYELIRAAMRSYVYLVYTHTMYSWDNICPHQHISAACEYTSHSQTVVHVQSLISSRVYIARNIHLWDIA